MKQIAATVFVFALSFSVFAQNNDTMFVVKKGKIAYKFATRDVDSIIFYHAFGLVDPPKDTIRITDTNTIWIMGTHANLGMISFTGTILTVSTQQWSDAVQTSVCGKKTSFNSGSQGNFKADCRSNPNHKGDLFSWEMINQYGSILCPAPWRVPTKEDFEHLDIALGGTGESTQNNPILRDTYLTTWGGNYGGNCDFEGYLGYQDSSASYWSQSKSGSDGSYRLYFNTGGSVNPQSVGGRLYGFTLRCVQSIDTISPPVIPPTDTTPTHPALGKVSFSTATTYPVGSQTWSDAVQTVVCSGKTSFDGGSSVNYKADCRSNPGQKGDLFSWEMVRQYKDYLCPAPWRVPTKEDFKNLDIALGGTGELQANSTLRDKYLATWGGTYGGACAHNGALTHQGTKAAYWSSSEYGSDFGYYLNFLSTGSIVHPQNSDNSKDLGNSLRCVR